MNPVPADNHLVLTSLTAALGIQNVIIAGVALFIALAIAWFLRGIEKINTVFVFVFLTLSVAVSMAILNQQTHFLSKADVEAKLVDWHQQRMGQAVKISFTTSGPAYAYLTYKGTTDKEFFPYTAKGDLTKVTDHEIFIPNVPLSGGVIYIYIDGKKNPPGDPYQIK